MKNCPHCFSDRITVAQEFPKGAYSICCQGCGGVITWGLNDKQATKDIYNKRKGQ